MQSSIETVSSFSDKIIIQNPESEECRCRICYEQSKPLITLCDCSGTIAYVHEDCILDWITKKMENADTVEIPKCEICKTTYSAKLKIGHKKVCYKTLAKKIRDLKAKEITTSIFFIIATIIALFLTASFGFNICLWVLGGVPMTDQVTVGWFILEICKDIIFPMCFFKVAVEHGQKRMKLWNDSMVQIVQLTLNPKAMIKQ